MFLLSPQATVDGKGAQCGEKPIAQPQPLKRPLSSAHLLLIFGSQSHDWDCSVESSLNKYFSQDSPTFHSAVLWTGPTSVFFPKFPNSLRCGRGGESRWTKDVSSANRPSVLSTSQWAWLPLNTSARAQPNCSLSSVRLQQCLPLPRPTTHAHSSS